MTARVGYSTRLGPISPIERSLLDLPGVETVELDLLTEQKLVTESRNLDYLLVGAVEPVTRAVIQTMDRVRLIVRRGTGTDNVDIQAATEFGIGVANVPDASVEEVSDQALALLFNLVRHVSEVDRALRSGHSTVARGAVERAPRLSQMTVGVVGLGRIGTRLAEKALHLFGGVLGHDPYVLGPPGINQVSLEEVLANSDAVSAHVPLTDATHHMFNEQTFRLMKAGSFFVNTARGELVDEAALAEVLGSRHLAGAGLDVLAEDPPTANHPLLAFENVIVSGHTGAKGAHASLDLRRRSVGAVVAALSGDYPETMLNPEAWPEPPRAHAIIAATDNLGP